jgi:hypothetical protein
VLGGIERLKLEALRQQIQAIADVPKIPPLPDLEAVRDRILKRTRSDKLKAVEAALNRMIAEVQNGKTD